MKAFTDLEQSKKLAEILPLESADMYYFTMIRDYPYSQGKIKTIAKIMDGSFSSDYDTPCWSLAALLGVVPYLSLHKTFSGWRCDSYNKEGTSCILGVPADNPVDACYEMIIKLHEQKLL